jgi:tRNA (cmo5U34)-methyltransferase
MDDRVREQFSSRAQVYDANRRLLIADFDEFYTAAADIVAYDGTAPRVLDLGAGTGLTTEHFLHCYPEAHVTLVDFSAEMLDQARSRFSGQENIRYIEGDYRSVPTENTYDVIISGLSIHHLPHADKQALFTRVYDLLEPGGEFVNADLVRGVDEHIERFMQRRLNAFLKEGLDDKGLAHFHGTQVIDDPATLSDQLTWLQKAGFSSVDCVYRRWIYAIFYARR